MANSNEARSFFPKRESLRKLNILLRFLNPYRWHFLAGILLLSVSSLVFMVFPVASGELINIATGKSSYGWNLNQIGIGLILILVVQSLISFTRIMLFTYMSERGMADIRKAVFARLVTAPITFFENHRVAELSSRTTSDVQQLQDALSIATAEFLRQVIVLVAGIAYLLYKTRDLALLMFSIFPVIVILAIFFGRRIRKASKTRQDEVASSNVILEEALQSIQAVKAFVNESFEVKRFQAGVDRVVGISIRLGWQRALFLAFIIAVLFGVIFYILWQGALMVQRGSMSPGDLVSFIAITAIIGGSLGSLGDFYTQLLKAVGASERLVEILEEPQEIPLDALPEPVRLQGHVRFSGVGFAYPSRPEIQVLKGIDLEILPGQKVALVGQSGAGKSTIVQLLLQFYQPGQGDISIDGKPVGAYSLAAYRANFAIVPQEVLLFGGTIRENILYGKPDASEEEIIDAAVQANAWEFISQFPEGLDTIVGERGIKLSGGQRQRIAIARAILKNPRILLLDEATSSLDAESEKVVQEALENLMKGRTSVIIAHRLATIRNVDRIYVLEDGRISESGTHEELFALQDGLYRSLARLQFDI